MTIASDFRLYHSNSLEVLAGLLAAQLRQPAAGQPLLAPDTVLIPQVAMRRWLQATLAAEHGVAANLEFLTPGEFVARALQANPASASAQSTDPADDLDAATLHWRLYAALSDAELLRQPALAGLRAYLADGDALKPWALAGELAAVFEKYQAWRRDWLLRWEAGADPLDPQAVLWRQLAAGRGYRARRIHDYLARFADGDAIPAGMPTRLFAFATLNVSPDVLRVLASQARVGTLHFYLPTPTKEYWGDLQTLAAKLRAGDADPFAEDAGENPLLQAWGAAGRDFMAVLGSYEVVHPSGEIAAYVDPQTRSGPTLAEGGLADSLLRRLQSDLFHRRGQPVSAPRAQLDRNDPSLQLHACHTRLRELQVLHDQLRALLDDPRFEPPLQPREIAVLAPDIDPYVPYLDAVFGSHGGGDALPYTLADASPLASEPLAEVFLSLLALPVSRFGLHEILDLLASMPIAEQAGLDASSLERLRGWLHAAGVRWGLDPAHRAQHQAPADDAYTWRFALERLLLGHASGAEDEIAGVAPWPQLEGSALAALDGLLRLLRVLERQQLALAEALPAALWRERLLALLDAVVVQPPAGARAQRTLERLRSLIDQFARNAERAGVEQELPAEVVRAHFSALLGEADTRAPLLTGGISFGRMVPMRLLPFRVICLLGMNDGDFPRRDPAAGLNRLTAELGSERRRYGDRSTRDDDRFLFLQLFAAAQDVFYLSYLGADARDGSRREPSLLVSELLAATAPYHSDPQAASSLLLRHSLQPFAAAAFGAPGEHGADPRRFSYRRQWRPAVDSLGSERQHMPPWLAHALPPVHEPAPPSSVAIDELRRLFADPAGQFLRQRLSLRLPEVDADDSDLEPLTLASRGLQAHALQQQVFAAAVNGQAADDQIDALYASLRARALLPSGPVGRLQLDACVQKVLPYAQLFAQQCGSTVAQSQRLQVPIDGIDLHGRLADWYPSGLLRVHIGEMSAGAMLRQGLEWLLLRAAGKRVPYLRLYQHEHDGIGLYPMDPPKAPLSAQDAQQALGKLLQLYRQGLHTPLMFAPYSSWKFYQGVRANKLFNAIRVAASQWQGGFGWSEAASAPLQLVTRGRDPFTEREHFIAFANTSVQIYSLLESGSSGCVPNQEELDEAWQQWRGEQEDAQ